MNLYTIDFETYYDKEYSLKKMEMEEYIRDPRFEVLGGSIKKNAEPAVWYTQAMLAAIIEEIDWVSSACLAHNAAFDCAILSWRYNAHPKFIFDSMSLARPQYGQTIGVSLKALAEELKLGHKLEYLGNVEGKRFSDLTSKELAGLSEYCLMDTELTHKLFTKLVSATPQDELSLIDLTIRMFTEPTLVLNKSVLNDHLDDISFTHSALLASLPGTEEEKRAMLMSNNKFAEMLKSLSVNPPMKVSKTTGKPTLAFAKTDPGLQDLRKHADVRVRNLVDARLGTKSTIEETRSKSLLGVASRGRLPVLLNYWGAHTGRYSGGGGLNLQNLPRGGMLRKSVCAPAGHVLIASDLSQIEARMLALLAGQSDLVESFREGRDVYSDFASAIYGRPITKEDKLERFVGKTCILGLGYGMGPEKLQTTLATGNGGISVAVGMHEAVEYVQTYRRINGRIKQLWKTAADAIPKMAAGHWGMLTNMPEINFVGNRLLLPNSTSIAYPELGTVNITDYGPQWAYTTRKGSVHIYGGKVVENAVQALARVVIVDHMLKIKERYHIVLQAHDEIVVCVPENDADEAQEFIKGVMSTPPAWAPTLPIACEISAGRNYGECK